MTEWRNITSKRSYPRGRYCARGAPRIAGQVFLVVDFRSPAPGVVVNLTAVPSDAKELGAFVLPDPCVVAIEVV